MPHDRQSKVLASFLVVLGSCGFLLSFALSFQSLGLGQGLKIGDAEIERIQGKNPFGYSIQNTHQRMASDYAVISVCFVAIALLGVIPFFSGQSQQVIFPLISIASAAVAANILRVSIRDKAGVEASFYEAPRNHFVELTIAYDWFLLILIAAVILISSFLIIQVIGRRPR